MRKLKRAAWRDSVRVEVVNTEKGKQRVSICKPNETEPFYSFETDKIIPLLVVDERTKKTHLF